MKLGKSVQQIDNEKEEEFKKIKSFQTPRKVFAWVPKRISWDGRYAWLEFVWTFALIDFEYKRVMLWHVFATKEKCMEIYQQCVNAWKIKI